MHNTREALDGVRQAAAREHASREHANVVRPALALLNQIDPDTDVSDVIRQLLHLAVEDGHMGSDRPELLMADAWLMFATCGQPDPGASRIGHDDDSLEARALLISYCGGTLPENAKAQLKLTSRLIAGLLRATLADGYAVETNDLSDLLADAMAAVRTLATP